MANGTELAGRLDTASIQQVKCLYPEMSRFDLFEIIMHVNIKGEHLLKIKFLSDEIALLNMKRKVYKMNMLIIT